MITHPDDEAVERAGILASVAGKDEVFRDSFVENLALEVWNPATVDAFMNYDPGPAWGDIWILVSASTEDLRTAFGKTCAQRGEVGE